MRQVDRDELVYTLFYGLRCWRVSVRRRVFAPLVKRHPSARNIACDGVAARLRHFTILSPHKPEAPLSEEALSALFVGALDTAPGAIACLWLSGVREREREGHAALAHHLADALGPYEILCDTSLGTRDVAVTFPAPLLAPHALRDRWP